MNDYIVIDTDILIDAGRHVEEAVARLDQEEQTAILATSVVTQMELIVGCRNKQELNTLERFLKRFEIITLNETMVERAVDLLRSYRLSHGLLIDDSLIAATALVMGIPLLSKNQRDYRFIEGLKLLPYLLPQIPSDG